MPVTKRKRVHQVKINLTDEENAVVQAAAEKEMRSVNSFVRVVVLLAAAKRVKTPLRGIGSKGEPSDNHASERQKTAVGA